MTYETQKLIAGRKPVILCELELDKCNNVFGVSPCTAVMHSLDDDFVTNGDFATDTDWSKGSDWTISGGVASINNPFGNSSLIQAVDVILFRNYNVRFTISNYSAGALLVWIGNQNADAVSADGVYEVSINYTSHDAQLELQASDGSIFDIDNVVLVELDSGTKCFNTFQNCRDRANFLANLTGTAQSGGATTIQLASGAITDDDMLNGMKIEIIDGLGEGQERTITDSVASSDTCTVATWDIDPDSTSVYKISNPKIHRFVKPFSPMPDVQALPFLDDINLHPTEIQPQKGLSRRATITASFNDAPHHDRGIDPYVDERIYTPYDQGTYFGKLKARNPNYIGRTMRIRTGYLDADGLVDVSAGSTDFQDKLYFIDRIEGPGSSGKVTIKGKDILTITEDKRAKVPIPNSGELSIDINAVVPGFIVKSGDGAAYSTSGTLRIGSEEMTFTRITDTFTVTRGVNNTTAAAHSTDDVVQECYVKTAVAIEIVIEDLLTNYASVPSKYIPTADWAVEATDWLSGFNVTTVISKPIGVNKTLSSLSESFGVDLYWDEVSQTIILSALKPPLSTAITLNDDDHAVADSLRIKEIPKDRISRLYYHYDKIDSTKGEDAANYAKALVTVDASSESPDEFDEQHERVIFAAHGADDVVAKVVSNRMIERFRDNPIVIELTMDAKDSSVRPGDELFIQSRILQDATGAKLLKNMQVISVDEAVIGTKHKYKLLSSAFDTVGVGIFGYVTAVGAAAKEYTAASEAEKTAQPGAGWICDNGNVFLSDGQPAYKII